MRTQLPFALLAITLACSLASPPAHARARVFVASYGNDSNPCTFGSPCRNFQQAVTVVDPGGEVTAIDSAGFGPVTITNKSVSITSPNGVEAGIAIASGGVGITINGLSTDKVKLRGLTLDGAGVGAAGIQFNGGASLTVENCVVRNVTADGFQFIPNQTTLATLAVSNSYFDDNIHDGIVIEPFSSGAVTASIDRTGFNNNSHAGLVVSGLSGTGALTVAVADSVAANGTYGFAVESGAANSVSNLSLTHILAEGNSNTGVAAIGTNATLWLAKSTATGNGNMFLAGSGGVINSYVDNYLDAANGAPVGVAFAVTLR